LNEEVIFIMNNRKYRISAFVLLSAISLLLLSSLAHAYVRETTVSIDPLMVAGKIAENNVTTEKVVFFTGSVSSLPGLKSLTWRNNRGGGGKVILKIGNYQEPNLNGKWFIGAVPLMIGKNMITVTARDMKGVRSSETITVIRE
jgi:hypothetical protein